jgi:hypothetical protein
VVERLAAIGEIAQARQHHVASGAARGAEFGLTAAVERAVFGNGEQHGNASLGRIDGDVEHLEFFVER